MSFQRSYRDAQGHWLNAASFGQRDLLLLAKVADVAHSRIQKLMAESRASAQPRQQRFA